jgi:ribonuclease G
LPNKEIIVNVGERETRIAVTEDGKLVELHIERSERVVGSIYKCRVANVLQGMDAAFVDIGLERNAFLYVGDVLPTGDDTGGSTMPAPTPQPAPAPVQATQPEPRRGHDRRQRAERRGRQTAIPMDAVAATQAIGGEIVSGADAAAEEGSIEETQQDAAFNSEIISASIEMDAVVLSTEATDDSDDHQSVFEETPDIVYAEPQTDQGYLADAPYAEIDASSYVLSDSSDDVEDIEEMDDADETDEVEEAEEAEEGDNRGERRQRSNVRKNTKRSVLRQQRIKDVLKVGQERLVQVIKGPRGTKGARVSTRISLPGRYLVLMPEADNLGVSRKIEDARERDRLKKIGERLREPGFGLIIRTEAEEQTEQELRQDRDFLLQTWREIQEKSRAVRAPYLVQSDLTLLYKTIRDVFGSDVSKLVIDDPAEYEKANDLLDRISPKLKGRIHLYDGTQPIFDHYKLEEEMSRLLKRKVLMKSGGSLVIDETEALTVIDVNTSKFTGGSSLAETILKTNVDAANEIARQLRLRDIGGIIVIDFIDMNNARDKQTVIKALEAALKRDRSRTKISAISQLGLVEMTRKRTGETLSGFLTDECPYCNGRGHLPSAESVSLLVERDLRRAVNIAQNARKDALMITCHPDVAELLIGPDGRTVAEIEQSLQRAIYVRAIPNGHIEKYDIVAGDISEFDKHRLAYRRSQVVECKIARSLLKESGKVIGWADGYLLDLDDGSRYIGQIAKVKITDVRRSFAVGQLIPGTIRQA